MRVRDPDQVDAGDKPASAGSPPSDTADLGQAGACYGRQLADLGRLAHWVLDLGRGDYGASSPTSGTRRRVRPTSGARVPGARCKIEIWPGRLLVEM
jgi:hypothetical protein